MNTYINAKIFGLPKPLRDGVNTSPTKKRVDMEYIHKCNMHNIIYYRVLIKRQDKYKTKYFKSLKEAKLFRDMLKENRYF